MSLNMTITPHTVYLLCGPTMCGKSTFAEHLAKAAEQLYLTSVVLSYDFSREAALEVSSIMQGSSAYEASPTNDNRHSSAMLSVSRQAFENIFHSLKTVLSYPICTEVVIIDTTGFDERFRNDILQIARNNEYRLEVVTFEYKTRAEYFPKEGTHDQLFAVGRSLDKFRKYVLPGMNSKGYDARSRVKNRDDFEADFKEVLATSAPKIADYMANYQVHNKFAVIGDSHECKTELEQLINSIQQTHSDAQIIHIGDYLDKGQNTKEMVDYVHSRVVDGPDKMIVGNHESYVFKRFNGEIKNPDVAMELEKFSSVDFFLKNPETLAKFKEIYAKSFPFMVVYKPNDATITPVIITHAPCQDKYIGKMSTYAIREQRNYRTQDRSVSWFKELEWYYKAADVIFPTHIVGHIAHRVTHPYGFRFKNKFFLDTGCVYGNTLTAAVFEAGKFYETIEVKSTRPLSEEKLVDNLGMPPKDTKKFDIKDYDLDAKDLRLLRQIEANGVKYISGTMSPAPSTESALEPLKAAFEYYVSKGVASVVLQPKYMGSRCQLYLHKGEPEKTFQVSRNGWKVRGVDGKTEQEYKDYLVILYRKYEYLFEKLSITEVILDGELLPWRALGAGLIDQAFTVYQELVQGELDVLATDEGLAKLDDFRTKLDVPGKLGNLAAFKTSLANYTKNTPTEYKAFDILHINGGFDASNLTSVGKFSIVNDDEQIVVDLETGKGEVEAYDFFNKLTVEKGMEGVVVKPLTMTQEKGVPPYLKVRSPEYLRLVYGYDYPTREERLCRQKNISGKVSTSIREYYAATEMLTAVDDRKKELIVKMIGEIKSEATLDPRL